MTPTPQQQRTPFHLNWPKEGTIEEAFLRSVRALIRSAQFRRAIRSHKKPLTLDFGLDLGGGSSRKEHYENKCAQTLLLLLVLVGFPMQAQSLTLPPVHNDLF